MANPFSGLENIGQSYLAGVQLAQQRQLREEALAQRQEEARIRERYYQDIIGERQAQREALRRQRMDQFASLFGRHLKLTPEGEVDIPGSALARDRAIQEEQLAAAEGELGALYGTQAPLSPEVIASPAYKTGKLRGTAKRLAQEKDLTAAMIRRGFIPADQEQDRQLPQEVLTQIEDISTPDIFSGEVPVSAASTRAGVPMGGGQRVSFGGRQWIAPTPALKKGEKSGTVKFIGPTGAEVSINLSPEEARSQLAAHLALPGGEQDPYADIDEAEKNLKKLALGKDAEVNIYEDDQGNIKVRKDVFGLGKESTGLTFEEAKKQLEVLRKDRKQRLKGMETLPGSEAGIQQGTNRVSPVAANRVIDVRSIKGLPPIGRASTNAPMVATPRIAVNSLQPASPDSSESLSELDPEELRQALLEARSNGIDPGVLGLELRQALNEAGIATGAGTNSFPLGLSAEAFEAIMRLPRGAAPVEP